MFLVHLLRGGHDQPQPAEGRQVRALEVAVHAGHRVEERVLEHVRGVDPALQPFGPHDASPLADVALLTPLATLFARIAP